MKTSVLFFSDSSLRNPIIHSQGLPFFNHLSTDTYKKIFLSIEWNENIYHNEQEIARIKNTFSNGIIYYTVTSIFPKIFQNSFFRIIFGCFKLMTLIIKYNVKIIHTRSYYPALITLISKILLIRNIKIVYDPRGLFVEERFFLKNIKKKSVSHKIYEEVEKQFYKKSDIVVLVSNKFKHYILNKYPNKFSLSSKIVVINNKTQINKLSNIDNKSKFVKGVYVGSAAPWQNVDELFSLISVSKENNYPIKFDLITYQKEIFRSKLSTIDNTDLITINSYPSDEVAPELRKYNFGILIRKESLASEVSSPLKLGEYLASGLPVLAWPGIGDSEEIIKKYNIGVIVKNKDYSKALEDMIELLSDENIYYRCWETARKEFNLDDSIKSYTEIYDRLNKLK
ncbi:MAG: glycosyltransferase [Ignavibacteria bacterium]|jgi:glycosyltransferase involved in cell wall biosynthesis